MEKSIQALYGLVIGMAILFIVWDGALVKHNICNKTNLHIVMDFSMAFLEVLVCKIFIQIMMNLNLELMVIQEIINRIHYSGIKIAIFIISATLCYSCADGYRVIKKYYSFKFEENKLTNIDSLINIEGYYNIPQVYNGNDTTYSKIIFFRNGLFANNFLIDNISYTGWADFWGKYEICGDTIKTQGVHRGSWDNGGYYGWDIWYKVIDRNTMKEIYWESLGGYYESESDKMNHKLYIKKRIILPIKFVPTEYVPSPDKAWILEEKWFWCNEQDWKAYMEKIKQKK